MAKQHIELSMGMLAFLVAGMVVLILGAIGSTDATCTAINHSNTPIQIRVLPLTADGTIVNVDVLANATVSFNVNVDVTTGKAPILFINKVTNNVSPTIAVADASVLVMKPSSILSNYVEVALCLSASTDVCLGATVAANNLAIISVG